MARDRQIAKILEFGRVWLLICGKCVGRAIGNPIVRAIDLEEPDINKGCDVAIGSWREVRSLDRG
ncbi:hypothetical protein QUB63_19905 [Microcoleus sp. ARI1-B5]|uniref:hypothetical protein n=1 Tax=unclassified Microcoleus TaxID=2642155 RepID=UPI002FD31418